MYYFRFVFFVVFWEFFGELVFVVRGLEVKFMSFGVIIKEEDNR